MQLNNLVIIPIPATSTRTSDNFEYSNMSPFKTKSFINNINNDDISWKKSISAFKKYKGKRDKQTKLNNLKPSQNKYQDKSQNQHMLINHFNDAIENKTYQQRILTEKKFTLANVITQVEGNYCQSMFKLRQLNKINKINNSFTNTNNDHIIIATTLQQSKEQMVQQKCYLDKNNPQSQQKNQTVTKRQQLSQLQQYQQLNSEQQENKWDYYDPCNAPFFQFGVSYRFIMKQNRVSKVQDYGNNINNSMVPEQQSFMGFTMKRSDSVKQRKPYNKRQTSNNTSTQNNNNNIKTSKSQSYVKVIMTENESKHNLMRMQSLYQTNSLLKKQSTIGNNNFNNGNIDDTNKQMYQQQLLYQDYDQELIKQKAYCSQGLLPQYKQQQYHHYVNNKKLNKQLTYSLCDNSNDDDPFIIIKSTSNQRREFSSSNQSSIPKMTKQDSLTKSKQIRKSHNQNSTIIRQSKPHNSSNNIYQNYHHNNPRSVYSYNSNKNSQSQRHYSMVSSNSEEDSQQMANNDYGNNQLQMIQFDLFNHINGQMKQLKQQLLIQSQSNNRDSKAMALESLSIFEVRNETQRKNQLNLINKQNQNKQIIKQYQFDNKSLSLKQQELDQNINQ